MSKTMQLEMYASGGSVDTQNGFIKTITDNVTPETPKHVSALIFKHWNVTYQNKYNRKTDMLLKQRYM